MWCLKSEYSSLRFSSIDNFLGGVFFSFVLIPLVLILLPDLALQDTREARPHASAIGTVFEVQVLREANREREREREGERERKERERDKREREEREKEKRESEKKESEKKESEKKERERREKERERERERERKTCVLGLGRYGDALLPWGDLLAIARAWCVTKPKGDLIIGVEWGKVQKQKQKPSFSSFHFFSVFLQTRERADDMASSVIPT